MAWPALVNFVCGLTDLLLRLSVSNCKYVAVIVIFRYCPNFANLKDLNTGVGDTVSAPLALPNLK